MEQEKRSGAEKRRLWQERLERAKAAYCGELEQMDRREGYYRGDHGVQPGRSQAGPVREASNVRNIVFELIESQVDSTVPQPRVEAIHPEDRPLAQAIEAVLRHEVRLQKLALLNDLQERTVPMQGGSWWEVTWDPEAGSHCTLGDVRVTDRHPKMVIPQEGVTETEEMDYLFLQLGRTRKSLERQYGVSLEGETEEAPEVRGQSGTGGPAPELVTQNIAYYRDGQGRIGRFGWVGDVTLEDLPDHRARRAERCARCGAPKHSAICPDCGGTQFEASREDWEELTGPVTLWDSGAEVPEFEVPEETPLTDWAGRPVRGEDGNPLTQLQARRTRVPYYRPKGFPLVLRRNIKGFGRLLGVSDVDQVTDQQEAIKKLGSKIDEKILKGGSYVTLPQGVGVETTDRELKIIRLKTPAEKALIDVLNIQPDVSKEMSALTLNYEWAKSTLGITDSYQGKYDASAQSGVARQVAASQAAGRLESKRRQKNEAYAQLYRMMFEYLLAYADQPIPYRTKDARGEEVFAHFDRWQFLRRDAAGSLYWDDEFLFGIDSSATMASSRDILWGMIDGKFQAGAFGPAAELDSQVTLWRLLESTDFPFAGSVRQDLEARREAARKGGEQDALPQV